MFILRVWRFERRVSLWRTFPATNLSPDARGWRLCSSLHVGPAASLKTTFLFLKTRTRSFVLISVFCLKLHWDYSLASLLFYRSMIQVLLFAVTCWYPLTEMNYFCLCSGGKTKATNSVLTWLSCFGLLNVTVRRWVNCEGCTLVSYQCASVFMMMC